MKEATDLVESVENLANEIRRVANSLNKLLERLEAEEIAESRYENQIKVGYCGDYPKCLVNPSG